MFLFCEAACLIILIHPGTEMWNLAWYPLEGNLNIHAYSNFFCRLLQQANVSQLGYLLRTAWAGASPSLPASSCPAPAHPGAAPEGTIPTCRRAGICAKEASLCPRKGWGPSPCGDLRGQLWLSQPGERCGCPGHQPLLALLPRGHKRPLIGVRCAAGAVGMAFVPLMGLCRGRPLWNPGRWLSAHSPWHGPARAGSAAGAGSAVGWPALRDAQLLSSRFSSGQKLVQISRTSLAKANKREIDSEWGNRHQ